MKIAFVGTAYPMRGGIAQYNALLCRELIRQGHEVAVYSFTRQYPAILFPGKTQMEEGADPAPIGARRMVDSIGPISWWRTANAIARARPEVLIFKYWMPFFAPAFGTIARRVKARIPGCKVVLICDNVIPHEHRPFDTALTRYMLGVTDAFIVMSKSVMEDLRRLRPDAPARLIPHPLYTHFGEPIEKREARRRLAWREDERVLLFFGYVRRYKGLDILLRAMGDIRAKTGARLVVLGEFYEERGAYDRIIADRGIAGAVTMTGDYVPNESVGIHFSASDLIVLPYRSATQSGIVQVAFQLERPVLCTRVGGLEEMVTDGRTGLIIPPEDEGAITRAVERYYAEDLEERLVPEIRRLKGAMGWDSLARGIVELADEAGRKGKMR